MFISVASRTANYAAGDSGHVTPVTNGRSFPGFNSQHSGGTFFALADGSVRIVSNSIDITTYRALMTCSGGEVVGKL
jgi:hypothetical protein